MKTTRPLRSFNGVVAGETATLTLPKGLTYHQLLFTRGGTTFTNAQMEDIAIKINGREVLSVSGAHLDSMNQFDGAAAASATNTKLFFDRLGLDRQVGREITALGTAQGVSAENPSPIDTLTCEVAIAAGAVAPTLSAKAVQSGRRPLGDIIKRRKFVHSPSAAGDYVIDDLPLGDPINRIWIFHTNVTNVKLERDNFLAFERTPTENDLIQTDGVRTPQSGLFVIDPHESGTEAEPIISGNVDDFKVTTTVSAADTLTVYVDYLGGLGGN